MIPYFRIHSSFREGVMFIRLPNQRTRFPERQHYTWHFCSHSWYHTVSWELSCCSKSKLSLPLYLIKKHATLGEKRASVSYCTGWVGPGTGLYVVDRKCEVGITFVTTTLTDDVDTKLRVRSVHVCNARVFWIDNINNVEPPQLCLQHLKGTWDGIDSCNLYKTNLF
jgi:hypothetical protein